MYRSREGMVMGVCRGIAEYFDFNLFWVRVVTLILFFISGIWPMVILYFIAALVMKPEPVASIHTGGHAFNDAHSKEQTLGRIRRRYETLERRIQRLEHTVTGKDFDWDSRMNA
jgi:phage shock protein C